MEHLDVLIVGAGLSGIGAAHRLQTDAPWADYAILEGRASLGGTWDLFRYPGIRSDSEMHTLGYPWRPWHGDDSIAEGADILEYLRTTATDAGIDGHIRLQHRVVRAAWRSADARWHVTAEHTDTGDTVALTCNFLLSCSGYYRYDRGHQPDFPGMDQFRGTLVHPQHWPEHLDGAGQRIVVIGSGATAVTLVPALAERAAHVTMLQRSPTYVVSLPKRSPMASVLRRLVPPRWRDEAVRQAHIQATQRFYKMAKRRPERVKDVLRKALERELPAGYDIDRHFHPRYDPWDQRLCVVPDGDLFKAISAGTASVITDTIDTFTESGLHLASGTELTADIIVTATGLELLYLGGIELTVDGEEVDVGSRLLYRGTMLEGVPNLAAVFGYTNASWTMRSDLIAEYVCRLLNHMRASGLRQCTPVSDGPPMPTAPMLNLTSGYVQRSVDRFPKQGDRFPWQVHQDYRADVRVLRHEPVVDDALRFASPARVTAGQRLPEAADDVAPRSVAVVD